MSVAKKIKNLGISIISTTCITLGLISPANSQILPEVWGTVGAKNEDISYGVGVRWAGLAVEVGTGENGATGGDFLVFVPLPVISPYGGIGWYSGDDDNIAYSGGVHIYPGKRVFFGGGYHSVRGVNGKLGFRF